MKKVLNKEDLAAYIETMPPATFLTLQGAGEYLRKKAAQAVRENWREGDNATTYKGAVDSGMDWGRQEQVIDFWCSLYNAMPDDLGIDIVVQGAPLDPIISDPNDPRVASLIGKKVYYSDFPDRIGVNGSRAYLASVNSNASCPFHIVASLDDIGDNFARATFRYIRAVEEPETIDVTMADVCAKFDGKNVRIRKE